LWWMSPCESFRPRKSFYSGSWPTGTWTKAFVRLTRRSDTDVEYETPANKDGMGFGWLEKNADPIRGMAIMMDMRDDKNKKVPKLVLLEVRTPPDMHHLVQTIMENTRQNRYQ
jgi:hypothetical protein